jgi:hypothetical protein
VPTTRARGVAGVRRGLSWQRGRPRGSRPPGGSTKLTRALGPSSMRHGRPTRRPRVLLRRAFGTTSMPPSARDSHSAPSRRRIRSTLRASTGLRVLAPAPVIRADASRRVAVGPVPARGVGLRDPSHRARPTSSRSTSWPRRAERFQVPTGPHALRVRLRRRLTWCTGDRTWPVPLANDTSGPEGEPRRLAAR